MILEHVKKTVSTPYWKFQYVNEEPKDVKATLIDEFTKKEGDLCAVISSFSCSDGKAKRVFVQGGDVFGMFVEFFDLNDIRDVYSSFPIPSRPDFACNIVNKNRIVMRNSERGAKVFRLVCDTDGTDSLEKDGLLFPDGLFSDGSLRITPYTGLHLYGKRQLFVYTFVESTTTDVPYWHVKNGDNGFIVSGHNGEIFYEFFIRDGAINVKSAKTQKVIIIKLND
jgi:hypothetical protein